MKFLLALVIAVGVLTYPAKIVIQDKEAVAAKTNVPGVHQPTDLLLTENTTLTSPTGSPRMDAMLSVDQKEVACLAKNIYFEAAVESTAGKLAVAHVTYNRVRSGHFPNTYCEVIFQGAHTSTGFPVRDRCQFSWYCDGVHDTPYPGKTWQKVQDLAEYFYTHENLRDITDGATHYHADYINNPRWTTYKKKTVKIDTHIFYR